MNKVILIGRLARDPELRATNSNISVAKFTIAVSRPYNPNVQTQEVDFIDCVVWRKQAKNLAKYCHKGSQVAVGGRIQNRNYTAQDGNKKYITEILCESITFLGSSNKSAEKNEISAEKTADNQVESAVNTMVEQQEDPFAEFGEEIVLSNDDLPF